jgi:hypothetical protein
VRVAWPTCFTMIFPPEIFVGRELRVGKVKELTGEGNLLGVMTLEGEAARSIGDMIGGNRRAVGDLLNDEGG